MLCTLRSWTGAHILYCCLHPLNMYLVLQHFSIKVGNRSDVLFSSHIYVDGTYAVAPLVDPGMDTTRAGTYVTKSSLKPFTFTRLEHTGDMKPTCMHLRYLLIPNSR